MSWDYAKDTRTEEQVERYFRRGIVNQQTAAEQFVVDMQIQHPGHDIGVRENEGDEFKVISKYTPDYVGWYDDQLFPLEIKVPEYEPKETFDLKKNQVDALVRIGGCILIATPTRRAFFQAAIAKMGKECNSDRLGNKPCYRMQVEDIPFKYWLHKPQFQKYNGGFYELLATSN